MKVNKKAILAMAVALLLAAALFVGAGAGANPDYTYSGTDFGTDFDEIINVMTTGQTLEMTAYGYTFTKFEDDADLYYVDASSGEKRRMVYLTVVGTPLAGTNTLYNVNTCAQKNQLSNTGLMGIFASSEKNKDATGTVLKNNDILLLPVGDLYYNGGIINAYGSIAVVGAGSDKTIIHASKTASYRLFRLYNRYSSALNPEDIYSFEFKGITFVDDEGNTDSGTNLFVVTCYNIEIKLTDVTVTNFEGSVLSVWANDTLSDGTYPTGEQNVGVNITLSGVMTDGNARLIYFECIPTKDDVSGETGRFAFIHLTYDKACVFNDREDIDGNFTYDGGTDYSSATYAFSGTTALGQGNCLINGTDVSLAAFEAKIGTTYYTTLAEAVDKAKSGETIELLKDLENIDIISLPAGVTLSGGESKHQISGKSKVYINATGGGTVQNVTFKNIHGDDNKYSAIYAASLSGKATIKDCVFDTFDWDAIQITPVANADIVITGNEFAYTGKKGENTRRYVHIQSAKNVDFKATVTGNTFEDPENLNHTALEVYYPTNVGKITLNNNKFETPLGCCVFMTDSNDPNKYVNRYDLIFPAQNISGESYTPAVVWVNGNTYFSNDLNAIPADATEAYLINNLTLTGPVTLKHGVDVGKTVTLDLNGQTITPATTGYDEDYVIAVLHGGNLTITDSGSNGTIDGSKVLCGIKMTKNGGGDPGNSQKAILTVTKGIIKGNEFGISGNGNAGRDNTQITITGGDIQGVHTTEPQSTALYQPQWGKLTITGGKFTGTTGMYIKCGSVEITGGEFNGTGALTQFSPKGGDFSDTGDAFVVESSNYPGADPLVSVSIIGGMFKSDKASPVGSYADNGKTAIGGFISGGKFSAEPKTEYIKSGYHAKEISEGDYKYEVVQDTPKYTVTFDVNGGTPITPSSVTVEQGQTVSEPSQKPTKEGSTFIGWYKGTEAYNFNLPVTESFTLTAQYEEEPVFCTVTFDADGGVPGPAPQTVAYGGYVLEPQPNPSKGEEYEFLGWFLEGSTVKYDFMSYQVTDNFTLVAHWKVKEVTEENIEDIIETAEAGKEVVVEVTAENKDAVEKLVKQAQDTPATAEKVQLEVTPYNTTVLAEVINDTQEEIVTPVPVVVTNNNKGAVETLLNNVTDDSKVSLPIDGNGTNIVTVLEISSNEKYEAAKVAVPEVIVVSAPVQMTMDSKKENYTYTLYEIAEAAANGDSAQQLTLDLVKEDLNVQDAVTILGNIDRDIKVIEIPDDVKITNKPEENKYGLVVAGDATEKIVLSEMTGVEAAAVSTKKVTTIEKEEPILPEQPDVTRGYENNEVHTVFQIVVPEVRDEEVTVTFEVTLKEGQDSSILSNFYLKHYNGTGWDEKQIRQSAAPVHVSENTYKLTFTVKEFSPFALVSETAIPRSSGNSSSGGASTWATVAPTPGTPATEPTPGETPGAVDVPGVKPIETPSGSSAKTPAPFVGVLAGLGAVAAVFGLRRK